MRKFKSIEPAVPGADLGVGHTAVNQRRGACSREADVAAGRTLGN